MHSGSEPTVTVYRPDARYTIFSVLTGTLSVLFAWSLSREFDWGSAFFLVVCAVSAIWLASKAFSAVTVSGTGLTLHSFGRFQTHVEYRQLAAVHQTGRFLNVIVVMYYPKQANNLLALEAMENLTLPAVSDQSSLLNHLEAHVPQ